MLIFIASGLTAMRRLEAAWVPDVDDPEGGYFVVNGQIVSTREEEARKIAAGLRDWPGREVCLSADCRNPSCMSAQRDASMASDFINGGFGR